MLCGHRFYQYVLTDVAKSSLVRVKGQRSTVWGLCNKNPSPTQPCPLVVLYCYIRCQHFTRWCFTCQTLFHSDFFGLLSFSAQAFRKFLPLFDRVLVERFTAETVTKGGIMLPEKSQGKVLQATVVAVGPGSVTQVSSTVTSSLIHRRTVWISQEHKNYICATASLFTQVLSPLSFYFIYCTALNS